MKTIPASDFISYLQSATSINDLTDALVEDNSQYIGNDPSSSTANAQYNLALGTTALDAVTTGDRNTAIGYDALTSNNTGNENTALGSLALNANTTGIENTALGSRTLYSNDSGGYNTALGYYALYYNSVRPGISGLWQVSGRNDVDYEKRVALDTWYVLNWSLWFDLVILYKTVFVVLNRKGAY